MRIFILLFCLSASSASASETKLTHLSEAEAFLLVDKILQLTEQDGSNALAKYKEWESQYIKIRSNAHRDVKSMGLYFFIVWISDARTSVHTKEEIGFEIRGFYEKDKELFLAALNKYQGFIEPVCDQLGGHFNLVGKDDELLEFISQNTPLIEEKLYKPYAERCLNEISKHGT